jgi:L-iditol 2-dehydrogenase
MKQVLLYDKNDIRIEDVKTPKPGKGEVLVKIETALTCGSDLKTIRRGFHHALAPELPTPFGHEFAGIVAEVGKDVEDFEVGDRIVCANSAPCGTCYFCLMSRESLCENIVYLNGAYAEYIVVPERILDVNAFHFDEEIPFYVAGLLEPLSCVLHGIDRSEIQPGDYVAIFGQGPIGLLFTSHLIGRRAKVIAIDLKKGRLERAERMGAMEVILSEDTNEVIERIRELTPHNLGVDVSIEAAGNEDSWKAAIKAVRKGGVSLMFGGCKKGCELYIDPKRVHYDEVTVIGVYHHTPIYTRESLSLLELGAIDADEIITHHLPLDDIGKAFDMMANGKALKVALYP